MTAGSVVTAIRASIAELRAGAQADTERFSALMADVVAVGATASPAERTLLLHAVAELQDEVAQALDRLGDALRKTGAQKTAMSGYGAIRAHSTAQRVRKRI